MSKQCACHLAQQDPAGAATEVLRVELARAIRQLEERWRVGCILAAILPVRSPSGRSRSLYFVLIIGRPCQAALPWHSTFRCCVADILQHFTRRI